MVSRGKIKYSRKSRKSASIKLLYRDKTGCGLKNNADHTDAKAVQVYTDFDQRRQRAIEQNADDTDASATQIYTDFNQRP